MLPTDSTALPTWLLSFDTAGSTLEIGLARYHVFAEGAAVTFLVGRSIEAPRETNSLLLPTIDKLCQENQLDLEHLGAVIVGRGPGSFTGVRIGVAAAKGIAMGCGCPLYGVSTTDAIAAEVARRGFSGTLAVVLDAMRKEVYPALFEVKDGVVLSRQRPDCVTTPFVAAEEFMSAFATHPDAPHMVVGDGLVKYREVFEQAAHEKKIKVAFDVARPSGQGLIDAWLASQHRTEQGFLVATCATGTGNAAEVLPIYTRASDAEEAEKARQKASEPKAAEFAAEPSVLQASDQVAQEVVDGTSERRPAPAISYRALLPSDVPALAALEEKTEHPLWTSSLLLSEFVAPQRILRGAFVEKEGELHLVAFVAAAVMGDEVHIFDIVTAAAYCRRGYAQELLEQCFVCALEFQARGATLEVRRSNMAALALYRKLGFREVGVRPNYYPEGEDGLIFSRDLIRPEVAEYWWDAIPREERPLRVLGIESSCDETAFAVLEGERVTANVVASQIPFHARFGGVVPEIASRKHTEAIVPTLWEALEQAGSPNNHLPLPLSALDALAVTECPGLIGALIVGLSFAKGLSWASGLPLYGINHLEGHLYANTWAGATLKPPFVALIVSGGHTLLVASKSRRRYHVLGSTLDDATGEAFDKVAKALGLPYPGGPTLSRLAQEGKRARQAKVAKRGAHSTDASKEPTAESEGLQGDAQKTDASKKPVSESKLFSLMALRKKVLGRESVPDEFYDAYEKSLTFPDASEIEEALSADGLAGKMYPDFERRWEQQEMARRVAQAQESSEHLVVEAGTGVGKSLAYLLCAALLAQRNTITVGIATKTNALADQLLYHELPRLASVLPEPLRFTALKGYEHYPCLRKLDTQLKASKRDMLTGADLANLVSWVAQTDWGDFDAFNFPVFGAARRSIMASAADCSKRKCRFYHSCYVHGLRRHARSSHIVVTNHSLLFRDTVASGGILPPIRYWIVDEAHGAETEARRQLAQSVSETEIDSLCRLMGSINEGGALGALKKSCLKLRSVEAREMERAIEAFDLGPELQRVSHTFFDAVKALRELQQNSGPAQGAVDIWIGETVRSSSAWQECLRTGLVLQELLERYRKAGQELATRLTPAFTLLPKEQKDNSLSDFVGLLMGFGEQARALDIVLDAPRPELVYVATMRRGRRGTRETAQIAISQLSVANDIAEGLYTQSNSVIYSSATLSVGESFERFTRGVGLNLVDPEQWQTLKLDSSFDLREQMEIFIARDLPEPVRGAEQAALEDLLFKVHQASGGGVLTLFTNNKDLQTLYRKLAPRLEAIGIPLLAQTSTSARQMVSDAFLRDAHSSLFATKSFWEGFDAPGETLRCVVIPKLPFARPNDPLSQARRAAEGSSAWGRYDLPDAIIELRQAVGRLIRTAHDSGSVILGDTRLLTKNYGRTILDALPIPAQAASTEEIVRALECQRDNGGCS